MLPLTVLKHDAVTSLSHAAFRVLVLLAAEYNGHNNGAIGLTVRQAAEAGICAKRTVYAALAELSDRELIMQTYPASRVPPRPTMYALTWLPLNDTLYTKATRTAPHSYRAWRGAA